MCFIQLAMALRIEVPRRFRLFVVGNTMPEENAFDILVKPDNVRDDSFREYLAA